MPLIAELSGGSFFAKRRGVYPKAVDGRFRRLKWAVMAVTLAVYYVTPWLRWDRGPFAPDQAVLVDLANRRFYMLGIEIWPHEFYYVAGLLIMAGIGLFLVTSTVGRAWCGYACPQTVWTDLFQHVERFIDGDRNAQIRLAQAPWSIGKLARRGAKYAAWLMIAAATGGAWIFYFADAPTLARDFLAGDAAWVAYSTVGILTATTFLFGGFLREQVCIYMCPWPRIQGAMLDEKSLTVTYKEWRGEPRTHGLKKASLADLKVGDCVDCNACVAVCPTGIDIRQGQQIGCITCALCIDACDKVMAQVGRPRGLIDYTTYENAEREQRGEPPRSLRRTVLRPRTIIYFSLWALVGCFMLFGLEQRARLDISAQPDRNPVFVRLSDGTIRNGYMVKIRNMEARPRPVSVTLEGLPGAVIWGEGGNRETAGREVRATVAPDALAKLRIFVAARPSDDHQEAAFIVRALDAEGGSDRVEVTFEGPEQ
ncbi:MAG: cytochrome c oxidase accessory protein CcoG [Allosphingosinicella sp.]